MTPDERDDLISAFVFLGAILGALAVALYGVYVAGAQP